MSGSRMRKSRLRLHRVCHRIHPLLLPWADLDITVAGCSGNTPRLASMDRSNGVESHSTSGLKGAMSPAVRRRHNFQQAASPVHSRYQLDEKAPDPQCHLPGVPQLSASSRVLVAGPLRLRRLTRPGRPSALARRDEGAHMWWNDTRPWDSSMPAPHWLTFASFPGRMSLPVVRTYDRSPPLGSGWQSPQADASTTPASPRRCLLATPPARQPAYPPSSPVPGTGLRLRPRPGGIAKASGRRPFPSPPPRGDSDGLAFPVQTGMP